MKQDLIYINDTIVPVQDWSLNLLQLCEEVNVIIPRFCYHDELSVAGNCRMCLIELVNSPKPIISCGCSLTKEMRVYTNTQLVKKARENVMEFLLINHPLDCPICDQAGECDLQDQSFVYGSDRGRFKEIKRAVEDIELGFFIKTVMNRCIHCTRCIRYSKEILNLNSLSMLGRGRESEIGTYYNQSYIHELSGNVIDLCPVGALTSKPYTFSARPWELYTMESIDVLNSFCSDIKIDVKGNEVMRILPVVDRHFNTEWISDSIRFCFDSFKRDRLVKPLMYDVENNFYFSCSWIYCSYIINHFKKTKGSFFLGDNIDLGTIVLLNQIINISVSNCYIQNVNLIDRYNTHFILDDINKKNILDKYMLIVLDLNLKQDHPVLDSILKKKDKNLFYFGRFYKFNYDYKHVGLSKFNFFYFLKGKHSICNLIFNQKNLFLDNHELVNKHIFNMLPINYNCMSLDNNITKNQLYYTDYTPVCNTSYIHSHINKLVYNVYLSTNKNILTNSSFNIYIGSHYINFINNINLILPSKLFLEDSLFFLSISGQIKKSSVIIDSLGFTKSISDILLLFTNGIRHFNKRHIFNKKNKYYYNNILSNELKKINIINFFKNKKNNSFNNNILTSKSLYLLKIEYNIKKKMINNNYY